MSDPSGPRVLFFSGKGGVGKTTLAGTAAVHLGATAGKVLVASTDPAHSLSDLFAHPIGGEPTAVGPRVEAVEVDAPSTLGTALDAAEIGEGRAAAAAGDLLKLATHAPGVDEIVSLDLLLRLLDRAAHDTIVLDTAPTGHTLRLLALPELMDRYFGKLLKLRGHFDRLIKRVWRRKKGEELMDGAELGEQLSGARGRMQKLGELLRDPSRCGLVLVTIPEAMSVLETARTMDLLQSQAMPVAAVMVNMVQPAQPHCAFCTARRETHEAQLERIESLVGDTPLITIEAAIEEPRGLRALEAMADRVWASEAGQRVLLG